MALSTTRLAMRVAILLPVLVACIFVAELVAVATVYKLGLTCAPPCDTSIIGAFVQFVLGFPVGLATGVILGLRLARRLVP